MFAKNTLASAVAAAIGVSAVGAAQAGSAFWPYAAVSDTVTTIASVINTSDNNWTSGGGQGGDNLHYRFYYKTAPNTNDLVAPCQEYDEYLPTSLNDIQTIDLGGIFGAETAGVLFNDPSINNDWIGSGRDYAFGRNVVPARGYLYVDNADVVGGTASDSLRGEAFVFEFGSGAAWGYQAYNWNSPDYRWAASESPSYVALMPFTEITTAFFVTPVSYDQAPDFANDYRARVEFVSTTRGDLYDRDENLISGTVPYDVVCVGRVNAADMLTDATRARLEDGGWGRLWNYRVTKVDGEWVPAIYNDGWNFIDPYVSAEVDNDVTGEGPALGEDSPFSVDRYDNGGDPNAAPGLYNWGRLRGAVVIKLEYNLGGTINGEAVGGTYNNAIMYAPPQARY